MKREVAAAVPVATGNFRRPVRKSGDGSSVERRSHGGDRRKITIAHARQRVHEFDRRISYGKPEDPHQEMCIRDRSTSYPTAFAPVKTPPTWPTKSTASSATPPPSARPGRQCRLPELPPDRLTGFAPRAGGKPLRWAGSAGCQSCRRVERRDLPHEQGAPAVPASRAAAGWIDGICPTSRGQRCV